MKKLLLTTAIILGLTGMANASCKKELKKWKSADRMIHSFQISKSETLIWINNIRNFQSIDIGFYGFNNNAAHYFQQKSGCKNVRFLNAYDELGRPIK